MFVNTTNYFTKRLFNVRERIELVEGPTFRPLDRLIHHAELLDGTEAAKDDPHLRPEADWHDRPIAEAESVHGLVRVAYGVFEDVQQPGKASHQRKDVWTWFKT